MESTPNDDFEDRPAQATDSLGEKAGDVVDRYELVDKVGEGGMGTVWRASQTEPVKREVALKIIKLGMDTREVVVRFEAERQALALMEHPYIAKVLDGGATTAGRPFFVMELVQGIPITDYCNLHQLGLRARIELIVKVCEAVQHAHQKGVIHRDIKPSNVLVTERDGVPIPQVIDFGIAKATSAELTQKTLLTQEAQIIGTPEYMAPEQADTTGKGIDTRADVYSLGVLLYELLTGRRPFDLRTIIEKGYMELLRTIREDDPLRPSTRVTTDHARAEPGTGASANMDSLSKRLRGDLDWIVMKAIEKDRDRRYDSPNSLALDLQRHLRTEPVEAAPPSAAYRMRKFVRRRKRTVAAVAVISGLFIGGSISTTWGWWEAHQRGQELEIALDEKSEALDAESVARINARASEIIALKSQSMAMEERDRALRAEGQAFERAEELERVGDFQRARLDVVDLPGMGAVIRNTLLEQIPEGRRAEAATMLDEVNMVTIAFDVMRESIFGPTQVAIETEFKDDPVLQAFLLQHLARSMQATGLGADSADAQERALALMKSERELGGDHQVSSLMMSSYQALEMGDVEAAEAQAREAHRLVYADIADRPKAKFKAETDLGIILLSRGRFEESLVHLRLANELAKVHLPEDEPRVLLMRNTLAMAMTRIGSPAEAKEAEGISLGILAILEACGEPCALDLCIARSALAQIYSVQGDYLQATPIFQQSLEHLRSALGDKHPQTLQVMRNLAVGYVDQQNWAEAEPLLDLALDGFTKLYGEDHHEVWTTRHRIGQLLAGIGKRSRATKELEASYEALIRILGADHASVHDTRAALIKTLLDRGKFDKADPLLQLSLESNIRRFGEKHASVFVLRNNIGYSFEQQGQFANAEAAYREAHAELVRGLGPKHKNTLTSLGNIGTALVAQKGYEAAIPILTEALAGKQEVMGPSHPQTLAVHWPLARSLQATGRLEEAIEQWRSLKLEVERTEGVDSPGKITATLSLATCLKSAGDIAESQVEILDCWSSVREHLGEKHEYSMMILNEVVAAFEAQQDYEGALPWLEKQLELREQMSAETHPYTVGCRINLALGLQNLGRQEEALPLITSAMTHAIASFGMKEETTIQVYLAYAEAARATGEPEAGTEAIRSLIAILREDESIEDAWTAWAMVNLAAHQIALDLFDEAEGTLEEARTLAADAWDENAWHARELQSLTGVLHMHRGRFADAERELLAATEWMLTNEAMPRHSETCNRGYPLFGTERLLELYEIWGQADSDQDHSDAILKWTEVREAWLADPFR